MEQDLKHRAYHSWQLVFRNHVWKSGRFHLKSIWNLPDFTWNRYEICWISWNPYEIRQISWNPYEIHRISMNVSFCAWWSSIGLSFERPTSWRFALILFQGANRITRRDIDRVFALYDRVSCSTTIISKFQTVHVSL